MSFPWDRYRKTRGDRKNRDFLSLYERLRRVTLTLTLLMAILVALTVVRAARSMIFSAYEESAAFGLRTLGNELMLSGLGKRRTRAVLEEAKRRSGHERSFLLLEDGVPVSMVGHIPFEREEITALVKGLAGEGDLYIRMGGIGPFIELVGALKLDDHHVLMMKENARFLFSNYLLWAACILFIALLSSWAIQALFARRLFNPMMDRLHQIRRALKKYGQGDSSVRLTVSDRYRDEFDLVCEEFNRMADTIEALKQELEERLQAERRLLSSLAHDINTPVTILRGHAENLLEHGASLSTKELAGIHAAILDQSLYIQSLVDDLLTMAKSKISQLELVPRVLDLDLVFDQVLDTFEPLAASKGIALVADGHGLQVWADPVRLTQVLNNLVMNAIRHAQGASVVELEARYVWEQDMTEIVVADDGPGLPQEIRDQLFECPEDAVHASCDPHEDEHGVSAEKRIKSRTAFSDNMVKINVKGRGWGLGLSIVKMLVEMHGGTFGYRTNPQTSGAVFVVRLPKRGQKEAN